jgi:hypothetical protein
VTDESPEMGAQLFHSVFEMYTINSHIIIGTLKSGILHDSLNHRFCIKRVAYETI